MTEGSELCASLSPNEGKGSLFHTLVLAPCRELLLMMRKSEPFVPFSPARAELSRPEYHTCKKSSGRVQTVKNWIIYGGANFGILVLLLTE